MRHWRDFTGKEVVIRARGTVYEGVMLEMTETSILLRAVAGHREVPMDGVTSVELKGAMPLSGFSNPSPLAKYSK